MSRAVTLGWPLSPACLPNPEDVRTPAAFAQTRAPEGWSWDFVTLNGQPVLQDGEPVVALTENLNHG